MKVIAALIAASVALFGLAPLHGSPLHGSAAPLEPNMLHDLPPMNFSRAGHTLTTLKNGWALVVGGFMGEEEQIAGVELFDVEQRQFQAIDNLITPRQSHTATLLPNGRVLITGGYGAQVSYLDTAEVFDPATRRFLSAGRMKAPRAEHTAVALDDGRVALIGGLSTDWTFLDSVEIYDPKTGAFSEAGHMSVPRTGNVSLLLRDGRIFIAGGSTGRRASLKIYNTSEIFDPRSGRSIPSADMALPRHKHDGILFADGRVLITGGSDERDARGMYDSAEIFDPSRNTFTLAATMNKARYKHRGSSLWLPNGKVLIAGGAAQPELYDPTTDTFTLLDSDSRLHGSFSAVTLLRDHRALITGGYFRPDSPSNGAWIYKF